MFERETSGERHRGTGLDGLFAVLDDVAQERVDKSGVVAEFSAGFGRVDRFVDRRMIGDPVHVQDLIGADPQDVPKARLLQRIIVVQKAGNDIIERAAAAHDTVYDIIGKAAIAMIDMMSGESMIDKTIQAFAG